MQMEGDDPQGQPAEGVATLTDLVSLLDDGEESVGGDALDEDAEGEGIESEGEEGEEGEGEQDDEGEQDEPTVTLKHDGKEVTLKQSEVVELAQKGFDYTQKTMALGEDRKAAAAEREQASQFRKQYEDALDNSVSQLQALEKVLQGSVGQPPSTDLLNTDTALYITLKEQHEARRGQLADAQHAIAELQAEQARSRQAWVAQRGRETEAALKETLAGWNDTTLSDLIGYAAEHGLGEKTFDHAMLEKGFWQMAHKAKAYDDLLAKKAQMKPVAQLQKVAPTQARNQPAQLARHQQANKRYAAQPSLNTLADLL